MEESEVDLLLLVRPPFVPVALPTIRVVGRITLISAICRLPSSYLSFQNIDDWLAY